MTVARNLSLLSPKLSNSGTVNNTGLTNSAITINGTIATLGDSVTIADATKLPLAGGTMTGAIAFAVAQTWPTFNQSTTGSAATLTTGRTIALTGDVTYTSGSFNGSANVTGTATLASVGTAGTYTKVATDSKGRVTSGTTLSATDIPSLDASKITSGTIDAARLPSYVDDVIEAANLAGFPVTGETGKIYVALDTNKTYRWSGSAYVFITSGAVDSVAGKTGVVTLVKADVGLGSVDNTADSAKSVASAATLTTARTIGGVSFNGSANIDLPGVNTAGNQNTTGTAANVTGIVAVANGGTGATSLTANNVILGNGTSAVQVVAPGASGNVLRSNGTTWVSAAIPTTSAATGTTLGTVYAKTTGGVGFESAYFGWFAGGANPTGESNTFIGSYAGAFNTGQYSTAVGSESLGYNATSTTGLRNTVIGYRSATQITTGSNNALLGADSGTELTTGSQNVIIGSGAGSAGATQLTTGSNNIIVGYNAISSSATISNEVTIGNASITSFRIPGLGINWTASTLPNVTLAGTETLTNKTVKNSTLEAYQEKVQVVGTVSTTTYNIDLSLANIFDITLGANVTFTFTNPPASNFSKPTTIILRQGSAGNRLATFTNAKYTDGILPILSTGINQIDVLTFFTLNGGSFWFGTFAMANVS